MRFFMEQQWVRRHSAAGGFSDERSGEETLDKGHDDGHEAAIAASFSFASPGAASASSVISTASVAYDAVDMRLMDTFPASDAVARF